MARVTWSEPELKGLVEFVLFHSNGEHYPQHKRDDYWAASAADVVQKTIENLNRIITHYAHRYLPKQ